MKNGAEDREAFAAFLLRLRAKGIASKELVAAFEATPRSAFIPKRWENVAWSNRMAPIECGEAIEGADLQAMVLDSLAIEPGNRVLEIGTGSGFTAAVMSRLAGRVATVERYKTLADLAKERLEAMAITNVHVRHADGANGLPGEGPFDRIVVWAAFDSLPRSFADQLASGGTMIAVIGAAEEPQLLTRLTKVGSRFDRIDLGQVRFQPMIQGIATSL
ncbi:protein-L-isoaspartate(D-aspartate) O-methyltransferase [Arvimicrobium flavum]|uniref:protein-L-isoaspartate(D-aspartate) O-methyltransferase n=1 Tax=Arvimicrobium flavum TaxID=3393320 RepID=UPI00237C359A|nr:protein-L-isoaspartate(D-aspartate) O-methyltransferase [Mesorhizobium shangrilense]